jgi:hypothetical protein
MKITNDKYSMDFGETFGELKSSPLSRAANSQSSRRIENWPLKIGYWLLACFFSFSAFQFSAFGQTRSAVEVTNATGALAAPTNFFAANSNLLNQAVNMNHGTGGSGGGATNGIQQLNGSGTNTTLYGAVNGATGLPFLDSSATNGLLSANSISPGPANPTAGLFTNLAITSPLPINDNGAPYPLALTNSTNGLALDFTPDGRMDLYNYNAAEGSVVAFYDLGSIASLPMTIGHAGWRAYDDAGNLDSYAIIAGDLENATHTALNSRLDFGIMLNQNAAGGNAQPGTHFYLDPANGLSLPGLPITDQYGLVRIGAPGGKITFSGSSISNNIEVLNGAIGVGLAPTNAIMIDTSGATNNGVTLKNPYTAGTLVGNFFGTNGQGELDLYENDGAALGVRITAAANQNSFIAVNGGRFGIGTTAPSYLLDVSGLAGANKFILEDPAGGAGYSSIQRYAGITGDYDSEFGYIWLFNTNTMTQTNYAPTTFVSNAAFMSNISVAGAITGSIPALGNATMISNISTNLVRLPADWYIAESTNGSTYWAFRGDLQQSMTGPDCGALVQAVANTASGMQRTMHFCASPSTNGNLYGEAYYIITNTVVLTNDWTITGEGDRGTIIAPAPGGNGPVFQLGTAGLSTVSIVKFKDIRFEGASAGAASVAVLVTNCPEPNFEDCEFDQFASAGIVFANIASAPLVWATVRSCWFPVNTGGFAIAITSPAATNNAAFVSEVFISDSQFSDNGGGGILITNGFKNVSICNCRFVTTVNPQTVPPIWVGYGSQIKIENNEFIGFQMSGFLGPIVFSAQGSAFNSDSLIEGNTAKAVAGQMTNWCDIGANVTGVNVTGNQWLGVVSLAGESSGLTNILPSGMSNFPAYTVLGNGTSGAASPTALAALPTNTLPGALPDWSKVPTNSIAGGSTPKLISTNTVPFCIYDNAGTGTAYYPFCGCSSCTESLDKAPFAAPATGFYILGMGLSHTVACASGNNPSWTVMTNGVASGITFTETGNGSIVWLSDYAHPTALLTNGTSVEIKMTCGTGMPTQRYYGAFLIAE